MIFSSSESRYIYKEVSQVFYPPFFPIIFSGPLSGSSGHEFLGHGGGVAGPTLPEGILDAWIPGGNLKRLRQPSGLARRILSRLRLGTAAPEFGTLADKSSGFEVGAVVLSMAPICWGRFPSEIASLSNGAHLLGSFSKQNRQSSMRRHGGVLAVCCFCLPRNVIEIE